MECKDCKDFKECSDIKAFVNEGNDSEDVLAPLPPDHYKCEGCLNWDEVNSCWANFNCICQCTEDTREEEEDVEQELD